jgi:DNA replication and repair protein RecF
VQSELSLGPRFNIFYGKNAQGKTNLLESIYLLATMKSFKMARNSELISWNSEFSLIKGWVEKDGVAREISLLLEKQGKKAKLDQKMVTRVTDFFGNLNVVVFSPEELSMVRGVPDLRRRYLDRAVFTSDLGYLSLFHEYMKILKNRNTLLKSNETVGLDIWTEKLAECGGRIIEKRAVYLEEIKGIFKGFYRNISGSGEMVDIHYKSPSSIGNDSAENGEALRIALANRAAEERRRGTTLVGPHRDDIEFLLDGKPLKYFGSQGQQRSYILALKMAEIEYIQRQFGSPPILLLDDMTSELDRERNRNLMEFLKQREMQVFITTTNLHNILLEGIENQRTFLVEQGRVTH